MKMELKVTFSAYSEDAEEEWNMIEAKPTAMEESAHAFERPKKQGKIIDLPKLPTYLRLV